MVKPNSDTLYQVFIISIFLLFAISVNGQGWLQVFQKEGIQGFPYDKHGQTVAATNDGGSIVATFELSESRDSSWIYIFKTDAEGKMVFEKTFKDYGVQVSVSDIKAKPDGGYLIVGSVISISGESNICLMEINDNGNMIWFEEYPLTTTDFGSSIALLSDGGYVAMGSSRVGDDSTVINIYRVDEQGVLLWNKQYGSFLAEIDLFRGNDIIVDSDGNFVVVGRHFYTSQVGGFSSKVHVLKVNEDGEILWSGDYLASDNGIANTIMESPEGGYIIGGNTEKPMTLKLDILGNQEWVTIWDDIPNQGSFFDIESAIGGGYIITGFAEGEFSLDLILAYVNENGVIGWMRNPSKAAIWSGTSLYQKPDGSLIVCGDIETIGGDRDIFLIKADSLGNVFSSALSGTVHHDPELDCLPDPTESGLLNWLVQAEGVQSFTTLTDSFGHFLLPVDTGSYTVTATPPAPYWGACNNPANANITAFYDTTLIDFPVQANELCPYLEVSLTAPFLRRCFDNYYYVQYCNYGTVPAEGAYIEVTLDTFMTYQSSTIPLVSQNGNTLTFDLDSVDVNECGSFQITAFLDCDSTILGQTHCSEAHIFPDSLCMPPSITWDGSSIEVDVECAGDSVIFNIQNTGTGDMTEPLNYIIIEDQIVLLQGDFQLDAGETMSVSVFANGGTFHMEAEQSPEHPTGVASTGATIEGCGGWFSFGFFTQFSDPDASPFVDIDCQQNIGAYDPNDKQASPTGFGEDHLIEPQTEIEYLIRFQNTGTDTAFKVVIVDVLPEELNLATLRPGASSHAYEYSVSPEGWPIFTFNNIMLPDSNVNKAASHGFVRFRISQRQGNGHGTYIENSALIYFDFNTPIQTNTVLHKVGQIFPWTLVGTETPISQKPQFRLMPNPLTDSALLQLENADPGLLHLLIVTPSGQVVRDETAFGTGFEIQRGELPTGLYFFKIKKDGVFVGSGKLMVR